MKQIQTLDRKEQIKHPNDRKQIPLLFGRFGWQFQALLIWWDRPWCWLSYQNLIHEPYPRTIVREEEKNTTERIEGIVVHRVSLLFASSFCCYFARWGLHIVVFLFLLPFCLWTIELTLILFFRLFCSPKQHPKKAAHNRARVCVCERRCDEIDFPPLSGPFPGQN